MEEEIKTFSDLLANLNETKSTILMIKTEEKTDVSPRLVPPALRKTTK